MNRRVVGLVVAVVLAAVATVALYLYVNRADERAAQEFDLRQVYVATQRIEAGTPVDAAISQGLIQQREIPDTAVAEGAIGSLDQIQGQVATVPIVAGQQIVVENFGAQASVGIGSDIEVPEGLQAVSVDLSVVPGLAGFVDAGERISVLTLIDLDADQATQQPAAQQPAEGETEAAQQPTTPQASGEGQQARYVVQNALVLAIGQRVTTFDENGTPTGKGIQESNDNYIFTLALTPTEIEKLVFAKDQGTLWATLLPETEDGEPLDAVTTPGANRENLFQ